MFKKVLFISFVLGGFLLEGKEPPEFIKRRVISFIATECSVSKKKVDLDILHGPGRNIKKYSDKTIRIKNKDEQVLGHNTIWLKIVGENDLLKKIPVTYSASATISTVVAVRDIKYNSKITEDNIELREKYISRDIQDYYRSKEEIPSNYTSTQLLRAGEPVKKSLLRQRALVDRGETIQARIIAKGIEIQAQAKARERGQKGETIGVFIQRTRERMKGKVNSKNSVIIKVR